MGYYNIRLLPTSQDMTTFVTEFGKFKYNCPLMGMCASWDILKDKVDKMIGDTDGVKKYIDDILVLRKKSFYTHIEQPGIIFGRLSAVGLKVNAHKWSFGLKEII